MKISLRTISKVLAFGGAFAASALIWLIAEHAKWTPVPTAIVAVISAIVCIMLPQILLSTRRK